MKVHEAEQHGDDIDEFIHETCMRPVLRTPFFDAKLDRKKVVSPLVLHTKYSLEFLFQEGLLNRDGSTGGLSGLVAFSFESEPANLVLNRLLRSGALHAYC